MYNLKLSAREDTDIRIIWLHGWGVDHSTMIPLAQLFLNQTENYLLDLAGFGNSKKPDKAYSSLDYARDVAEFIKSLPPKKTIVVGHSNGGRVAVSLFSKYQDIADGIVLIAGAGLPIKHSLFFKLYTGTIKKFSPLVKKVFPFLKNVSLSSNDYRNASGVMRETFINLVGENLTEEAKKIKVPTLLIYSEFDREVPLYVGKEYDNFMENSKLCVLEGANHWSGLLECKKQVHYFITTFIREKL